MEEKDLNQMEVMMNRVVGAFVEDVQHKFEILADGQQMLSERIDRLEGRLDERVDGVEGRIDTLAADLSAHRRDTEAHRKGWSVRED